MNSKTILVALEGMVTRVISTPEESGGLVDTKEPNELIAILKIDDHRTGRI